MSRRTPEIFQWIKDNQATSAEVQSKYGVSRTTAWKWVKDAGGLCLGDNWHKLSELDKENKTAICTQCGNVSVYHRVKRNEWVCTNSSSGSNPEKWRGFKQPHGLTKEEARTLVKDSKCSICGSTTDLVVDHCHTTLKVRGVLCRNHNLGLGLFADNVEHLLEAVSYLKSSL